MAADPFSVVYDEQIRKMREAQAKQAKIESKNMGKVIGRRGILIKSIRTIVRSISAKHKHKIILELIASD